MKNFSTIVIDTDLDFILLLKEVINKTENLVYTGCSIADHEFLLKVCKEFHPSTIFINIDLPDEGAKRFSRCIRENFTDVFIVLMNMDDKQFGIDKPDPDMADGYLDKNNLFNEVINISEYLKNQYAVKNNRILTNK